MDLREGMVWPECRTKRTVNSDLQQTTISYGTAGWIDEYPMSAEIVEGIVILAAYSMLCKMQSNKAFFTINFNTMVIKNRCV